MANIVLVYFIIFQHIFSSISGESSLFSYENIAENGVNFIDISNEVKSSSPKLSINRNCAKQWNELISNNVEIIFKMADAWSKFPYAGQIYSKTDYGNHMECTSLKVESESAGKILGKHCAFGLVIPNLLYPGNITEMVENGWKLSYCIPDQCTANDLNSITGLPIFNDAVCSTQETDNELSLGAKISLHIFILMILLVFLSTTYELWNYMNGKKSNYVLNAFSLYANGKRLMTFTNRSNEQILCFHGMKFIGMWWIIAGHGGVGWLTIPVMNEDERVEWQNLHSSEYIMQAHLSVDSFFFISGFLLAYLYFKNEFSKQPFMQQAKAIPSLILHRYLRLTPAILMTYLFVTYLQLFVGSGPFYSHETHRQLTDICRKNWWTVFLYIQNYYKSGTEVCLATLWFVSADMQLFMVAPLVIIPVAVLYNRSFKQSLAALLVINLLFIGLPIFTKLYWRDYDPIFNEFDSHSRLTDYFIGVMMGVYMRHEKTKIVKISRMVNLLIWTITLTTMLGVILVTQEINLNHGYVAKSLCYSLTRPLWSIGLCWITFACFTGYGGFINWLLSNKFMQFGGKITYCLYLVHGPVVMYAILQNGTKEYISDYNLFIHWCGHFIVSVVLAIMWTLCFELPMITVERLVFGNPPSKPNKNK